MAPVTIKRLLRALLCVRKRVVRPPVIIAIADGESCSPSAHTCSSRPNRHHAHQQDQRAAVLCLPVPSMQAFLIESAIGTNRMNDGNDAKKGSGFRHIHFPFSKGRPDPAGPEKTRTRAAIDRISIEWEPVGANFLAWAKRRRRRRWPNNGSSVADLAASESISSSMTDCLPPPIDPIYTQADAVFPGAPPAAALPRILHHHAAGPRLLESAATAHGSSDSNSCRSRSSPPRRRQCLPPPGRPTLLLLLFVLLGPVARRGRSQAPAAPAATPGQGGGHGPHGAAGRVRQAV